MLGGDREVFPRSPRHWALTCPPASQAGLHAVRAGRYATFIDDAALAGAPVLLVNPRIRLATAAVFKAWDGVDRGPLGDWREGRNDLEASARTLVPEIDAALGSLAGARLARMSGSGATCFGLYGSESDRDVAQARIVEAAPRWWTLRTRLRT